MIFEYWMFSHLKNITVTRMVTCKFPASFIGYIGKSVYVGIWCLYGIITISSMDSLKSLIKEQGPQANIQYLKAMKQADESVHETLVFIT